MTPAPGVSSSFLFGVHPPTELLQRPVLSNAHAAGMQALAASISAEQGLIQLLGSTSGEGLEGWLARITPLAGDAVPVSMLASLPDFTDVALDRVPLSLVREPLTTPWVPLPPQQRMPGPDAPACPGSVRDLLLESAIERMYSWLDAQLQDLLHIQTQLSEGVEADKVDRGHRPSPIAIGQDEVQPWARGIVWDCRKLSSQCCVPLDFHAPLDTDLNLDALTELLSRYPDQTLVSYLLEGVRLEADVELQTVLVPHLMSLPKGFASVEKELRRLHTSGWYEFFADAPFWPMYANGQGATSRKLEPDRWRRTTEGGGPRKPTFDASGLRALSINEASHIHHMPQHFVHDSRPEMLVWLAARRLPRDAPSDRFVEHLTNSHAWGEWPEHEESTTRGWQPHSKWPKEEKPTLSQLMRDIAVLRRAAERLGEPIYVFGDDIKDYFNQLAISSSDLPKLNIVFLAREGELAEQDIAGSSAPTRDGNRMLFVSEKRLGFGTHGASNIAQRVSFAVLDIFRDLMDEMEVSAPEPSAELKQYWAERLEVQETVDQSCHDTRRFEAATSAGSTTGVNVCPQQRLYSAYMFTDDACLLVVGRERALRALKVWREVTEKLNLTMAIPEKRSLGTWIVWLGVIIVVSLGVVVVPRDKLLRATVALSELLADGLAFRDYRSLCGLLEHLRAVNLRGRNVMHGLYAPHGPNGASRFGPSGWVRCTPLMRQQMERWLALLSESCGARVTAVLHRYEVEARPSLFFDISSDACLEVADGLTGIAGYFHGAYWVFIPGLEDASLLAIGALELLGVAFNIICFAERMKRLIQDNPNLRVVLRTDALTSALTLPAESQNSPVFVAIYQWLRAHPAFILLESRLIVAHTFGETNPFADKLSRSEWEAFFRLCSQIRITPYEVALPGDAMQGLRAGLEAARLRQHQGGCSDAWDSPIAMEDDVEDLCPQCALDPFYCRCSLSHAAQTMLGEMASFSFELGTVLHLATERHLQWETSRLSQRARRRDAPLVITVAAADINSSFANLCCRGPLRDMEGLGEGFRDPWNTTITLTQDDSFVAGMLLRVEAESRTGVVLLTYTHPSWRQQGWQRLVNGIAESTMTELGVQWVVRQANNTTNESRVALCEKLGYSATSAAARFFASYHYQHPIEDCVAMEKPLGIVGAGSTMLNAVGSGPSDNDRLEACRGGGLGHTGGSSTPTVSKFVARRQLEQGLGSSTTAAGAMVVLAAAASSQPGGAFLLQRVNAQMARPSVGSASQQPTSARTSAERVTIAPKPKMVGSLQMPSISVRPRDSSLSQASRHYANTKTAVLAAGGEPDMQLRADIVSVMGVGAAIDEVIEFGVNANTNTKDERAWSFWEHVCEQQGTSPLRTAQDVRDYPERQSFLLAALLMYAFAVCKPTDKTRAFVKPRSALAYPLAIVRIFGRWGIVMPGYKAVVAALNGLMRAYLLYHGPYSLAPKRAEPMKFSMVRDMNQIEDGTQVGKMVWNYDDHDVFMFRRLNIFLILTAFRLAELVYHASGEIMYITRDAVTWHIAGMVLTDPSPDQLRAMRPGLDFARCRVPRSKPDQWGEVHCPFPVTLTYYDEPENGAAALREIETCLPCHGDARATTPLFSDANGKPYTHARLGHILRCVLTFLYGASVAALFTFHSYRSGLATALHAAGVADGMIQLICRWMCPESLHVYRRVGASEHDRHIRSAMTAKIDVLQAGNVPVVSADAGYATLVQGIHGPLAHEAQRDYEDALRAAKNPAQATTSSTSVEAPQQLTGDTIRGQSKKPAKAAPTPMPTAPLPPQEAPSLKMLDSAPQVGDSVFVPRECWPSYPCNEFAGEGWAATVQSKTRYTATVSFDYAQTSRGAAYADERLDWMILKGFA